MPLYEYQCARCGRFEVIQKFSDAPLSACPTCGQDVHKLLSAPAIQFKGTGWYITDYARKSSGAEAGEDGSGEKPGKDAGKDTKDAGKGTSDSASTPKGGSSKDGSATGAGGGSTK